MGKKGGIIINGLYASENSELESNEENNRYVRRVDLRAQEEALRNVGRETQMEEQPNAAQMEEARRREEAQRREESVREQLRKYQVDTGSLQVFKKGMADTGGVNASMTSTKRNIKQNIFFTELGRKKSNAAKIKKAIKDLDAYHWENWVLGTDEENQKIILREFVALDFSTLGLGTDREFVDSIPTLQRIFFTMKIAEGIYKKEYENQPELKKECERKIRQAERLKVYFDIRSSVITDPVYKKYKNSEIGRLEHTYHNDDEHRLYKRMALLKEAAELIECRQADKVLDGREIVKMKNLEDRLQKLHRQELDQQELDQQKLDQEEINQKETPVHCTNSNSLTVMDRTENPLPIVSHLQSLRQEQIEEARWGHVDPDDYDRRTAYQKHEEEYRAYQEGTLQEQTENSHFGEAEIKLLRLFLSCLNPSWDLPLHERRDEVIRLRKVYQSYIEKNKVSLEELQENSEGVSKLLYDIHRYIIEPLDVKKQIPAGVKNKQYANPKISTTQFYVSKKDEKLFYTQPCVTDIQQRTVSGGYLLSALSSIAYMDPKLIMDRMIDNGDTVSVRFVDSETDIVLHEDLTLDENVSDQDCLEKLLSKYGDDRKSLPAEQEEEQRKKKEHVEIYRMLGGNNKERFSAMAEAMCNLETSEDEQEKKLAQQVGDLLRSVKSKQVTEEAAFSRFVDAIVREELSETLKKLASKSGTQRVDIEEYVTVSKEIPRYLGLVDANAANSLWVQMIEKAFAARFTKGGKYEELSQNTSFSFLEHFLGKEYCNTGRNQIVVKHPEEYAGSEEFGYMFPVVEDAVKAQRKLLKEQNYPNGVYEPDIEMVIAQLKEWKYEYVIGDRTKITEMLEEGFGLTYGIFDLKYSEAAERLYEDLKEQLAKDQIITVKRAEEEEALIDRLNEDGIRANRAYAVLAVEENTDGAKSVILKDPYCRFRRSYRNWNDGNREVMTVTGENTYMHLDQDDSSGIFRVTLNDFMQIFNEYSGRKKR